MIWKLLLFLSMLANPQSPLPPYGEVDTLKLSPSRMESQGTVVGDRLYTSDEDECLAWDLRKMRRIWSVPTPVDEELGLMAVHRGVLYVTTQVDDQTSLLALRADSGKLLWLVRGQGSSSAMAFGEGRIYLLQGFGEVVALDLATHKTVWRTHLPLDHINEDDRFLLRCFSIFRSGPSLVLNYAGVTSSLRVKDGKMQWSRPGGFHLGGRVAVHKNVVWMPVSGGSEAREVTSGKLLWKSAEFPELFAACIGGRFVGLRLGRLACLDAATGKSFWVTTDVRGSYWNEPSWVGGYLFVQDRMFDLGGRVMSGYAGEMKQGQPRWTDGKHLVTTDGKVLRRLVRR